MDFKAYVADKISAVSALSKEQVMDLLEVPPDTKMGDLAFPCFSLAKIFRKAPPMIATELAQKIATDELLSRVDVVGGYLNLFFNQSAFAKTVLEGVLEKGDDYGKSTKGQGKRVLIEFSSPNIAKPFHIGHLFSTAVGNSLEKIYSHLGYETVKINHLGDWGTQFGKLISAFKRWGNREVIEKDPIVELLKIYVKFHEEVEVDAELDDEARMYFKKLEDGDEEMVALWQYFREVSLLEFNRVYDLLGISFDSFAGESFYGDKMGDVVKLLSDKKLLVHSENAQVVMLDEFHIPPCIILKSDGATIYATRDLAAAIYRKQHYDFAKNIYVVGIPQALHFKQVFSVLKKAGHEWADDCVHVGFGLVKFADKKLSTRHGDVIFLEDVLNESIQKTLGIMEANSPALEDKAEVARKVGIGSVIYTFLKNNRERDIIFSWEDMLDFEGESAPYIQYSYARGMSILRKAGQWNKEVDYSLLSSDDEFALLKQLYAYGDAVKEAANKNEPSIVTRYVTVLARAFNKVYNANPILKAEEGTKNARLALVEATLIVIRSALTLLGIEVTEKM